MRAGSWLLSLVTHNPGWKLLSLAIAVVVWGVVANEPELSTFTTVGVEYKNLPDELEISSDPVSSVKLELHGPQGELPGVGVSVRTPQLVLDMATVQPGERTFTVGSGNLQLGRSVKLVRAIPAAVRFHFERRARHAVKVTPRFTERPGYVVSNFSVTPDALDVIGPASRVARVELLLTDPVNVPAQAGTFNFDVNAFQEDPFVRFRDEPRVTVSVTVKKK